MNDKRLGRISSTDDKGEALDRIFVHDYVLDVEIGVHHHEKGVTQRVRFSVDVDIVPSADTLNDDIESHLRLRRRHQRHQIHHRPRSHQSGGDPGRGGGAALP